MVGRANGFLPHRGQRADNDGRRPAAEDRHKLGRNAFSNQWTVTKPTESLGKVFPRFSECEVLYSAVESLQPNCGRETYENLFPSP